MDEYPEVYSVVTAVLSSTASSVGSLLSKIVPVDSLVSWLLSSVEIASFVSAVVGWLSSMVVGLVVSAVSVLSSAASVVLVFVVASVKALSEEF